MHGLHTAFCKRENTEEAWSQEERAVVHTYTPPRPACRQTPAETQGDCSVLHVNNRTLISNSHVAKGSTPSNVLNETGHCIRTRAPGDTVLPLSIQPGRILPTTRGVAKMQQSVSQVPGDLSQDSLIHREAPSSCI